VIEDDHQLLTIEAIRLGSVQLGRNTKRNFDRKTIIFDRKCLKSHDYAMAIDFRLPPFRNRFYGGVYCEGELEFIKNYKSLYR
jgi:hypothetical protein